MMKRILEATKNNNPTLNVIRRKRLIMKKPRINREETIEVFLK